MPRVGAVSGCGFGCLGPCSLCGLCERRKRTDVDHFEDVFAGDSRSDHNGDDAEHREAAWRGSAVVPGQRGGMGGGVKGLSSARRRV